MPSYGDDLGEDRDGDFLRRNGAEIEPRRRLHFRELGGVHPIGREGCRERSRLLAAADEGDVVGLARESGAQGGLVATSLRRDDDEAHPVLAHRQGIALDAAVDFGEGALLGRRRAGGDGVSGTPREVGDGDGDRARAAHDDLRPRQDRLDENVHGAVARAHVLGEANAGALLTGVEALLLQDIGRLDGNQARLPVGDGVARCLEHGSARAAAADPALGHGAVRPDHGLGAGLDCGGGDRPHHRHEREGLALGLDLRSGVDDIAHWLHVRQILAR